MVTGGFHIDKPKEVKTTIFGIVILKNNDTGNYELMNIIPKSLDRCRGLQLKTVYSHKESDKIIEEIGEWLEVLFNGTD